MAVPTSDNDQKNIIDINGADGNAFSLLAHAKRFSNDLSLDTESILKEMQSDYYSHLVRTFDKHFGEHITLSMTEDLKEEIFG